MCAFLDISGLSDFLTVVTCFLLLPSGGMSSPTRRPNWVNACGGSFVLPESQSEARTSDQDLLSNIILSASVALNYAEQFSHEYVRKTFSHDFDNHHNTWRDSGYSWLPSKEIPKSLGVKTPQHHLSALAQKKLDHSLVNIHRYLQTIAVGLEQVHLDKLRNNEEFVEEFDIIQQQLRAVLCEVQSAISNRTPDLKIENVSRDIMATNERQTKDAGYRHLRDWFIFRDFINCLEYVIEVCEFFKESAA